MSRPRADRVVLSYPADLSQWGRSTVEGGPFRAYLRKAHDRASPGDTWSEFVGVGCCGSALDVPLQVESVETEASVGDGEASIGPETTFEFVERGQCDLDGGWAVQSARSG